MNKKANGLKYLSLKRAVRTVPYTLIFLGILLMIPRSCKQGVQEERNQEKPNVLFFFIDDLRPNLGCYGDEVVLSPHIDSLAGVGVVFNRAYCQQAVCNPSRTSLLTGLRPDETGVTDLETHFRDNVPEVVTLPQLFKNNGYLTLGAGKVFHATPFIIDSISWTRPIPPYEPRFYLAEHNRKGKTKQDASESADVEDTAYPDGKIALEAIDYLKEAKASGQPFFIAVGFNKPHLPFCAPKKYWDLYEGIDFTIHDHQRPENSPELAFHNWDELRGYRDIPDTGALSEEKIQELWQGYYACISYTDALVGMVISKLEELELAENTIIVLWGDHGYHLGEQDIWCKSTNFELDARVPLIISAPGTKAKGQVCDAIIECLDIYPTLAELCEQVPENRLSGLSLKPFLENPGQDWEYLAFHQFIRPLSALRSRNVTHMGYAVRTREWRCTRWYDLQEGEIVGRELYYMENHSIERENLAGKPEYAEIESELALLIDEYRMGRYRKTTSRHPQR
jgi:iduronate 2-sulfatase